MDAVTLNRFSKFIHSPYFNKNQKITSLFDITHNDLKKGNAVKSKETLWTMVGFADGYKDIKFRKLCNDLVALYEEFLTVEQLLDDEMLKSNLLINGIKQNDSQILIEKHISKSNNIFDRIPDKSSDFYLQKYLNEKTLQNLKTNYEKKEDIKKYINEDINQELATQLDAFYVIEKLRHAIDIITWSKQYKIEYELDLSETLRLIDKSGSLNQIPAIRIYYLIYKILTIEDSQELYFELRNLAEDHIYMFPKAEQAEIFDALFSYCIKWVNIGIEKFLEEYLDLQEWGIKEDFVLKRGILSPTSFRNYVVIGLRLNEIERVENYINNNLYLLDDFRQDNALNFNMARVSWYKKNFDDVLLYLNQVNYDDIWYNINSRYYLLAAYYELQEYDVLESAMDSFLAFLRREKSIDTKRKKNQILFVNSLKKLLRYQNDKVKLSKFKLEIQEQEGLINKSWLLEKIEELL